MPAAVLLYLELRRFGALCEDLNVPPDMLADWPADQIDALQAVRAGLVTYRNEQAEASARKQHGR
jgi:hypothetical protein